jgi:hypothetical protein
MERLTIDGGEVWLGFARNRVKAFRRAGIRYTRQVFEMPDGAKVAVELAGKDHTIRLQSAPVGSIISGVVKGGQLVELPVPEGNPPNTKPEKILRSFKATADAAKKVLKKPEMATKFRDVKELATPLSSKRYFSDPNGFGSQVGAISAGMYTGLMKRVIQTLIGLKKQPEITYTYDFYNTYGVHKASDGSFWLILVSKEYGVLAMPLILSKANTSKKAPKAELECHKIFKGIPTGDDFPANIEKAITDKKVLRLATKEKIKEFYELNPYYEECGWSFNLDGTEAHNTGHKLGTVTLVGVGTDCSFTYHYKLSINIKIATDNQGKKTPTGDATLSRVSHQFLHQPRDISLGLYGDSNLSYTSIYDGYGDFIHYRYSAIEEPATIFVGHSDEGVLTTVGYRRLSYGDSIGKHPQSVFVIDGKDVIFKTGLTPHVYGVNQVTRTHTVIDPYYDSGNGMVKTENSTTYTYTALWGVVKEEAVYVSNPDNLSTNSRYGLVAFKDIRDLYILWIYQPTRQLKSSDDIGFNFYTGGDGYWEGYQVPELGILIRAQSTGYTITYTYGDGSPSTTETYPPIDYLTPKPLTFYGSLPAVPPGITSTYEWLESPKYNARNYGVKLVSTTPSSIQFRSSFSRVAEALQGMDVGDINKYYPTIRAFLVAINLFGSAAGRVLVDIDGIKKFTRSWGGSNAPPELPADDSKDDIFRFVGFIE